MKGSKHIDADNLVDDQPLVTVIVPVYNVASYVEKCIGSIRAQSYTNLEILLVNDGSTDASPRICEKAAKTDDRIKVLSKKNGGLSDARNHGIRHANGVYLAFIDGDDFVDKDFIGTLLTAALNSAADISVCNYYTTYEDGRSEAHVKDRQQATFTNIQGMRDILSQSSLCEIMTWNKLYKKELFTQHGLAFPLGKYHEDMFTTYKLFYYAQKITFTAIPLYFYVQRQSSITGAGFNPKSIHMFEAADENGSWVESHDIPLRAEALAYQLSIALYVLSKMADSGGWDGETWIKISNWIKKSVIRVLAGRSVKLSDKIAACAVVLGRRPYTLSRWTMKSLKHIV